jgi:DUF4097 and DUF4098 domain-containing protein YvlB
MKRGFQVAGALGLGLVLNGCVGGNFGTPFRATVDETRPLAANGEFSLENTNGSVRLTTWDEARVRIEAVKRARSERALEELKVEIVAEADRVSVRTRYPRPHWLGNAGSVEYRVSVPRGARVRVSDVNGSVEVEVARVEPSGRSELHTTNGSVRLTLPRDASADVEASTVNGSVGCDFDLADGRKSRRKLEGRIGSGGARFEIGTVNGSVHVDRGLSAAASSPAEATPERPSR